MEPQPPRLSRRFRNAKIRIGDSPCGRGVFAVEEIRARSPVGRILGEIKPPGYRSEYCMGFRDGGIEPEAPYRFVNHSCDPNCELIEWEITNEENGEKIYELWLHTVRKIAACEQLTIDYAWSSEAAIPCRCGSPTCRGWIVRQEELARCLEEHRQLDNAK